MKIHHHHHQPLLKILPDESADAAKTIRKVVKIGCAVNALLLVLKLCAGYFGHSDALVADGFHSLNDLAADIIMLIFIGISYRSADSRYSYGYGKFETFSSFLMSAFLIIISTVIAYEGVESIVAYSNGETLPQPELWTLWVVVFAMACKEGLYRFYYRTGKRTGSKALMANAWHHRSDALASVATLIGVGGARFFGESLRVLDPIASCLIALFIFVPALKLFRNAFAELMEHSLPKAEIDKARDAVAAVVGVEEVVNIRSRRNGHHVVLDVEAAVDPELSMAHAHVIAERIRENIRKAFCPHAIVSVTLIPDE